MFLRSILSSFRDAFASRRFVSLVPVLLILALVIGSGARAALAMPEHAETPVPAVSTPAQATPTPAVAGLSHEAVRALFSHDDANEDSVSEFSALLYQTAMQSPLAPPLPTLRMRSAPARDDMLLPTPTPTAQPVQPVALSISAPMTATAPITQFLDLPLSDQVTELSVKSALPTPTPVPSKVAAVEPTPDGAMRSVRVPILMYHYLSVPPANADIYRKDLSVSPELFAAHLDAMQSAGYTAISLYELVAHLTQGAPLPEKPVIITFDDGYRDVYEYALPSLRARNMVATFFVVTDFMDEERPEYLTWDMAREMRDAGMKIESHGRNHVSLKGKDTDYLIWQALGSSETIEHELGIRPRFVSYPAGEYDRAVADLFASAGYWAGATTVQGATHSSDALFDLHRVRVRGTTTPEELLRLLALDW